MFLRHRLLRKNSSFLPRFSSGYHYQPCRRVLNSLASSSSLLPQQFNEMNTRFSERFSVSFRHSTISQLSRYPLSETHLLSFIESAFDQLQGPHHFWLNRVDENKDSLKKDGTFLVVAGRFFEKVGCDPVVIFEKVKLLQQRFPLLRVIGFQDCSSICSADDRSQLIQLIMKEYITFPILLSNKNFSQLTDEACFILSKDFKNPLAFHEKDLDLAMLNEAIEELSVHYQVNNIALQNLKRSWSKEAEIIKEPHFCTALRNLLLYFPVLCNVVCFLPGLKMLLTYNFEEARELLKAAIRDPDSIVFLDSIVCNVVPTIMRAMLMDRSRRIPLIMVSATSTFLGCFPSGTSFYLKDHNL